MDGIQWQPRPVPAYLEGHCMRVLDGAVYADKMRRMREEGRITVPYEPTKPVPRFGTWGGATMAIWFVCSQFGMQLR